MDLTDHLQWIEAERDHVYSIGINYGLNFCDVEDVFQDTVMKCLKFNKYNQEGKFDSFLLKYSYDFV